MIETGRRQVVETEPGRGLLAVNWRPALQGLRAAQAAQ